MVELGWRVTDAAGDGIGAGFAMVGAGVLVDEI
jgi:hypothetical protein